MNNVNPLDTLIELVHNTPTYNETASWCLPAEFVTSKMLTAKHSTFVADRKLATKPKEEFVALDFSKLPNVA